MHKCSHTHTDTRSATHVYKKKIISKYVCVLMCALNYMLVFIAAHPRQFCHTRTYTCIDTAKSTNHHLCKHFFSVRYYPLCMYACVAVWFLVEIFNYPPLMPTTIVTA